MAKSLLVRDVDDELVERLESRAARHNRSPEAEHREILRQVLPGEPAETESFKEFAARFRAQTAGRRHTPSGVLLRESRDER